MLHLASQSPRRRELLARLGLDFGVLEIAVPEMRAQDEPAQDYVRRVAREKAGAGLLRVVSIPSAVVIAADTEVVLDDRVFGKPRNQADASAMLHSLSNRTHQVVSAVCVISAAQERQAVSISEVTFAALSEHQIETYLKTDEWQDKAGAYAIQGAAQAFIAHLSGSYSGVMGLPLFETARLLEQFDIALPLCRPQPLPQVVTHCSVAGGQQ